MKVRENQIFKIKYYFIKLSCALHMLVTTSFSVVIYIYIYIYIYILSLNTINSGK